MNLETLRAYCLSFAYAAENVQWDDHLVFRIALAGPKSKGEHSSRRGAAPQGKIFCIASLGAEGARATFKTTPEIFAELVERDGIIPAPYLARNHWVAVERWEALTNDEFREYVRHSYDLVWEKLPMSTRARLDAKATPGKSAAPEKKAKAPRKA